MIGLRLSVKRIKHFRVIRSFARRITTVSPLTCRILMIQKAWGKYDICIECFMHFSSKYNVRCKILFLCKYTNCMLRKIFVIKLYLKEKYLNQQCLTDALYLITLNYNIKSQIYCLIKLILYVHFCYGKYKKNYYNWNQLFYLISLWNLCLFILIDFYSIVYVTWYIHVFIYIQDI